MNLKVWADNRSGLLGCIAGNLVLSQIAQEAGLKPSEIVHEKGTIFQTPTKVIVGRICTSDKYLQKDVAHFCNISATQTQDISSFEGKESYFLFITISMTTIHYWLVPIATVEKVMKTLKPKPSSPTCFVRIYNQGDKTFLGDQDITAHHRTMPMRGHRASRLIKAAECAVTSAAKSGANGKFPISFKIDGVTYEGTVAPKEKKEAVTA